MHLLCHLLLLVLFVWCGSVCMFYIFVSNSIETIYDVQ